MFGAVRLRKIFVVTERRADYSRFKPILELIDSDPDLSYDLVVTGLHLSKKHGYTIEEIIADGFSIYSKFKMFNEEIDTAGAMVRSYAEAVHQLTFEALFRNRHNDLDEIQEIWKM